MIVLSNEEYDAMHNPDDFQREIQIKTKYLVEEVKSFKYGEQSILTYQTFLPFHEDNR